LDEEGCETAASGGKRMTDSSLWRKKDSKTVNSKNIYFQFFGNNFNIDECYYDDTCKP